MLDSLSTSQNSSSELLKRLTEAVAGPPEGSPLALTTGPPAPTLLQRLGAIHQELSETKPTITRGEPPALPAAEQRDDLLGFLHICRSTSYWKSK